MSDHKFCLKLVKAIEKNPCIYNFRMEDYAKKFVVEKAWELIAAKLNEDVQTCKAKWRNIRTVFGRHRRLNQINTHKKAYYLTSHLQFLIPFLKHYGGTKTNSAAHTPESVLFVFENDDEELADDNEMEYEELDIKPTAVECYQSIQQSQASSSCATQGRRNQKRKLNDLPVDKSTKLFLLSLLPDLETMGNSQLRVFKRKVLALVDEILV